MAEDNPGRGRPRDPSYDEAISEATLGLLREKGYQGLTMIDVARRADVAKTTIYRRWSSKAELVLDAISEELEAKPLESYEDPVDELRELITGFYRRLRGRAELLREPDIAEAFGQRFLEPLCSQAVSLIERVISEQEQHFPDNADPAVIADTLVAPALYHPLLLGESTAEGMAEKVFDLVMSR